METTLFLAQFMGVFAIIGGLSMLLERKMLIAILDETAKHRALLYLIGLAEVAGGILIILKHRDWSPDLPLIVTLLGWLLLIEGAIYVFIPAKPSRNVFRWLHDKNIYTVVSLCYLLIGIYLAYSGFFA